MSGAVVRVLNEASAPAPAAQAANPSEDAIALAFVDQHPEYRYVPERGYLHWDGVRWKDDSTGRVFECIRNLVRDWVLGGKAERTTANASFVGGVERLIRTDQRIVVLAEQLDADPWGLNTPSGIVDLRTGIAHAHDPEELCTRCTAGEIDRTHGAQLWADFLRDVTEGDDELERYLQRLMGYCATGSTAEDLLAFIFGHGANGKSTFAEVVADVLGDYARVFSPEILMVSRGERHPTDLAQFQGVRFALTSEPSSTSAWNDSRIKSLTGDRTISARFIRRDFFTFTRTHKTVVLGNHRPRLNEVTHAIRRRMHMIPFRAVFAPKPGPGIRERLRDEAGGAILAWIVEGAALWQQHGTAPPECVRELTAEYLEEQDLIGQWLEECCERDGGSRELSSALHRNYKDWCGRQNTPAESNQKLSEHLASLGFRKRPTAVGKMFDGLRLKLA